MDAKGYPVSVKEGYEFIDALVEAGFSSAHAKQGIASPELANEIVALCDPGLPVLATTTSLAQAKAIMGGNFHDPAQWASKCDFRLTKAHKASFAEVPFSVELLKLCKETHILVPILKLSIMQLHGRFNALFCQKDDPWYSTEAYASEQAEVGWMLVRREVVPGSTSLSWADQQALITEGEQVPGAAELVQAVICHAVLTEERLLPSLYARTSSVDSDGRHVYLGYFDSRGLYVDSSWVGGRNGYIGLASSRK